MQKKSVIFESLHGSSSFPIDVILNTTDMTGRYQEHFMYCHWHKHVEFIHMTGGKAVFEVDTKRIAVQEGQGLLINRGELHSGYALENSQCTLYAIIFDPSMLRFHEGDCCQDSYMAAFLRGSYRLPGLIAGEAGWERKVLQHMQRLVEVYQAGRYGYELKVKAALYEILAEILENGAYEVTDGQAGEPGKNKLERMKKVLAYIQSNYMHRITVEELADLINMSDDNFYRVFKAVTGRTPIEYINLYRIRSAEKLLRHKELSVLEVAMHTGFENVSYFIKTFRRHMGCTPGEYSKKGGAERRE